MKNLLLLTAFVLGSAVFCNAQTSTFDNNDEGWVLEGDPVSTTPVHNATGGNPNGYCHFVDRNQSILIYWIAPANFVGDKSGSFRKFLRFDVKVNRLSRPNFTSEVVLQGGGITIHFDDTATNDRGNPGLDWTHYDVPLWDTVINGFWERNSVNSKIPVTVSDFQTVLANLTVLKIRGEYSSDLDIGSIDNIVLETGTTDVEENYTEDAAFEVFPNPSSEFLTVKYQKAKRITIANTLGEIIIDRVLTSGNDGVEMFDISGFPSGVYSVKIDDVTRKFVKLN